MDFFKKPRLKAQKSRNIFDVSYKSVFHCPFGTIIPCGHWRLAPGDKVEITEENQFVVPVINRPAFLRLKEHIDYYAVPYSMLYTKSDNFFTGQSSYWSSVVQNGGQQTQYGSPEVPNMMPMFDPSFLKAALVEMDSREDIFNNPMSVGTFRLFDMLGYGNMYAQKADLCDPDITYDNTYLNHYLNVNLFNILAYQKIYYDYFRNDAYEENNVFAYNIDDLVPALYSDTDFVNFGGADRWAKVFELHQRWKKKDYFTNTRPNNLPNTSYLGFEGLSTSVNFSNTLLAGGVLNGVGGVTSSSVSTSNSDTVPNYGNYTFGSTSHQVNNTTDYMNVSAIRFAFAYDKLLRRMREAGQDFDKQMLAQFGITPIDQRHGKCHYIGGYVNRIKPSSVLSTGDTNTGDIKGNIDNYAQNNRKLHYTAKEHCILMAVYSTSLDVDYNSLRLDRENIAQNRFDWYHPAFENQGLQPIFGFEYNMFEADGINTPTTNGYRGNSHAHYVIGLTNRYSEYKTHVDEVHGLFNNALKVADFNQWTSQQGTSGQIDTSQPLEMKDLIYSDAMLENVIKVQYAGTWDTDPFIVNMYNRVKKISNMSVYGEDFGH